jgi:hypothetical protein
MDIFMNKLRVFMLYITLVTCSLAAHGAVVKGVIEKSNTGIKGWACITGKTDSIRVHVYIGGPAGTADVPGFSIPASNSSKAAVDAQCLHSGIHGNHRFSLPLSAAQINAYKGKPVYVYGIGADGVSTKLLSGSGVIKVPNPMGIIGGIYEGKTIYGWACLKENKSSVAVDLYAENQKIRTVTANLSSEPEIDAQCGHSGYRANHRFSYTLTASDKLRYGGSRLSAVVSGSKFTNVKFVNSYTYTIPAPPPAGKVAYTKSIGSDNIALQWDYSDTASCDVINATVFSFAGRDGASHADHDSALDLLEEKLGMGCIRLIRVNVNPSATNDTSATDSNQKKGYWLHHDSYRSASNLMTHIITNSIDNWSDETGPYAQGKIIVAGISAGGTIAASALEFSDVYRTYVAKTIMLSSPLGYDVSFECQKIENLKIKKMLDGMFSTADESPETSCAHPDPENGILEVSGDKDVVNTDVNPVYRPYLESHEVTIFVSESDGLGCKDNSLTSCNWSAIDAVYRYIGNITGGYPGQIFAPGPTTGYPHVLYELGGSNAGSHDLWQSEYVRKEVCLHAFAVVNKGIDKIPVAYCE